MNVYHGSFIKIEKPDLSKGREKVDFGKGFYVTEDMEMAKKWSCNKKDHFINQYYLNLNGLKTIKLSLTPDWLHFIASNRGYNSFRYNISEYDVIIGPTADDKMFDTLDRYFKGDISADKAIQYLNLAKLSDQIALKTQKAISNLSFVRCEQLNEKSVSFLKTQMKIERTNMLSRLSKLIKEESSLIQNLTTKELFLNGEIILNEDTLGTSKEDPKEKE